MEVQASHIDLILARLEEQKDEIRALRAELAQVTKVLRQGDRQRWRPQDLATDRLHVSVATVYRLWNSGKLRYSEDGRGRYSTEAQVREYETLYCS